MMTDDDTLIRAVAQGDEKALRQLMERYGRSVWHTAWMLLGDRMLADDVEQEVFIRLWRNAERLVGRPSMAAWLHRTACNLCLDELRRRKRQRLLGLRWRPEEVQQPPTDAEEADLHQWLHQAISVLPKRQREVYVLREVEQLSAADVALALRCSVEQVKANLYYARKAVRKYLKDYGIQ